MARLKQRGRLRRLLHRRRKKSGLQLHPTEHVRICHVHSRRDITLLFRTGSQCLTSRLDWRLKNFLTARPWKSSGQSSHPKPINRNTLIHFPIYTNPRSIHCMVQHNNLRTSRGRSRAQVLISCLQNYILSGSNAFEIYTVKTQQSIINLSPLLGFQRHRG